MDHSDPILTLTTEPAGLTAARSRKLQTAVATVEHCLGLWQPFITAATTRPLRITIATVEDLDSETVSADSDPDGGRLHLRVPNSLLQEPPSRLAGRIVEIAVPAIVAHAERHPHDQPPAFWVGAEEALPPTGEAETGIQLEDLLDGDVLVVARHDGTPADADSRERAIDAYLCERLEEPGIAGRDGAFATDSAVCWTLELL